MKNIFFLIIFSFFTMSFAQPHHGHDGGRQFDAADTDGDGQLSSQEFQAVSQERFTELDTNGDGFLSAEEAKPKGMRRQPGPGKMLIHGLVKSADQDENQMVSQEEWTAFIESLPGDADGAISAATVIEVLLANRPDDLPEPPEMEDKEAHLTAFLDSNENGVIDADDFQTLFIRLDRNEDGTLSSEDRPRRQHRAFSGKGKMGGREHGMRRPGFHILVKVADADDDHELTQVEWQNFVASIQGAAGNVDTEALIAALPESRHGGSAEDWVAGISAALDEDGNGVLGIEEVAAVFTNLDRNQDGVVNRDDRPEGPRHAKR